METDSHLLMFTGTECTHCHEMYPFVDRLMDEESLEVQKVEVWHNAENAAYLEELDAGKCGGVPFFYNKNSKQWICGNTSYEKLLEWAKS